MSFVEEIDITIGDPPILDLKVFDSWLSGDLRSSSSFSSFSSFSSSSSSFNQPLYEHEHTSVDKRVMGDGSDDPIVFRGPTFYDADGAILDRNISESTLASLYQKEKLDQYRLFNHLEHYFSFPMILTPHLGIWFQLPQYIQNSFIEKYYDYDESIMREIINRKLAKSRKDLEDISEATDIPVLRVTRQSDNIKRMYTYLEEDKQFKGNLIKFVETNFLLSTNLSRRYACLLFFLYSKFNITSNVRLLKLSCIAIEKSCALIIAFILTDSKQFSKIAESHIQDTGDNVYIPQCLIIGDNQECWNLVWDLCSAVDSVDPDKALMVNLRELRNIFTGENLDVCAQMVRENLSAVYAHNAELILNKLGSRVLDGNSKIRGLIKSLLLVGAHLSQAREFRDLIEDIVTSLDDFMEETGLDPAETNMLLLSISVLGDCIPVASNSRSQLSKNMTSISTISRRVSQNDNANMNEEAVSNAQLHPDGMKLRHGSDQSDNSVDIHKFARQRSDIGGYEELMKDSRFELMRDWCRFLSTVRLCNLVCNE